MSEREEMEAVVEAILFATPEPVPTDRLLEVFPEREREDAAAALDSVLDRYRPGPDKPARGVMVDEVAGGVRLVTRPDLHGYLRKFFEVSGSNRLTMAAIETLAIVAYRQPITAPEIQELRGKNSSGVLRNLLERRLLRISGRKDVVGRPFLYSTTRDFLLHFGLTDLEDLPPLEELTETLRDGDFGGEPVGEDREESLLRQLALVEEGDDGEDGEDGEGDEGEIEEIEGVGEAEEAQAETMGSDRHPGVSDEASDSPTDEVHGDDAVEVGDGHRDGGGGE